MTQSSALRFHDLIETGPPIGEAAINFIRNGTSAKSLKEVSEFFRIPEARTLRITHVKATTAARKQRNNERIDQGPSEIVLRMSAVIKMATDVFENQDRAITWMKTPNQMLGGVEPLDLMDTEPGADSVRLVLNAIDTGGVA